MDYVHNLCQIQAHYVCWKRVENYAYKNLDLSKLEMLTFWAKKKFSTNFCSVGAGCSGFGGVINICRFAYLVRLPTFTPSINRPTGHKIFSSCFHFHNQSMRPPLRSSQPSHVTAWHLLTTGRCGLLNLQSPAIMYGSRCTRIPQNVGTKNAMCGNPWEILGLRPGFT